MARPTPDCRPIDPVVCGVPAVAPTGLYGITRSATTERRHELSQSRYDLPNQGSADEALLSPLFKATRPSATRPGSQARTVHRGGAGVGVVQL